MSRGLLNLATYSRPELLKKCLSSIANAETSASYPKLIVLQKGDADVSRYVNEFADQYTQIIEVDGTQRTPLQNINHNRWLSWKLGFENSDIDWMLSVEEDVVLHPSTLLFVEQILNKYSGRPQFRGVNLASRLSDMENLGTYSELRFGLHGCGAVITRETWNLFTKFEFGDKLDSEPLDALIEPILKTGYMVTPNLSLLEDFGWYKGTHTSSDSTDVHYVEISSSFKANRLPLSHEFQIRTVNPQWRSDCIVYSEADDFYFKIKLLLVPILRSHFYIWIYSNLRKLSRKIKSQSRKLAT
jgi:glycosyltransferase involved in cell wall biosynthesis